MKETKLGEFEEVLLLLVGIAALNNGGDIRIKVVFHRKSLLP